MSTTDKGEKQNDEDIPECLVAYFQSKNVDISIIKLTDTIRRFIRIRLSDPTKMKKIEQEIKQYFSNNAEQDKLIDKSLPLIRETSLNDLYQIQSMQRMLLWICQECK